MKLILSDKVLASLAKKLNIDKDVLIRELKRDGAQEVREYTGGWNSIN